MLSFRRKCPFHQFNAKKPTKYGLKLWVYVDAELCYVSNVLLSIGRKPDQQSQKKHLQ